MDKIDIRNCLEEEVQQICEEASIKKFRASQIFQWVNQKCVQDWDEMTNISKEDREKLKSILHFSPLKNIRIQTSADGTRKFLFKLSDGESIETVLMDYEGLEGRDRHTLCISTQVGCPVGCSFCATGMAGFKRNLSVSEITGQILDVTRLLQQTDINFRITNLVFMGMGEPLLNYDAVIKAITILNSKNGQNIGMRKMTISTSGVVPKISAMAQDIPQVGLAISLHSAKDYIRDLLVPMNHRYPLGVLIKACKEYIAQTSRRVTFEMALSSDNANKEEAEAVVRLLRGMLAHVNLIPINPVEGSSVKRPDREKVSSFKKVLEAGKIPVSIREEKGMDIDAACGQLRQRMECEEYESVNQS